MGNTYVPKYTSVENIALKLRARLKIAAQKTIPNQFVSQNLAKTEVDNNLIVITVEENEAYLDEYLGMVYVLPLQKTHAILRKCVDSLIMADLMQYHFTIAGYGESQDISGFGVVNKQEGYQIIRSLLWGYNPAIPGIGPEYIRQNPVAPIVLQGEAFLNNRQAQYLPTDQYTLVDKIKRSNSITDIKFGPEVCSDDPGCGNGCGTPLKKNGKFDEDDDTTCIVVRPF